MIVDRQSADDEVIKVLLSQIKLLRRTLMSKIIKDAFTGDLYKVDESQIVSAEQVQAELDDILEKAHGLALVLAVGDSQTPIEQPEVQTEPATQPEAIEYTAPTDTTETVQENAQILAQVEPEQAPQVVQDVRPTPIVLS